MILIIIITINITIIKGQMKMDMDKAIQINEKQVKDYDIDNIEEKYKEQVSLNKKLQE